MTVGRDLVWDGCLNVRDLGGHRTSDGGETRFGAIVRADSVRRLTEGGRRELANYGIRTVVDLRGDVERAEDPAAELALEVVHAPFMENDENDAKPLERELERVKALYAREDAKRASAIYLLFLEHFRDNVGRSFRAVARAGDGAVVIHCVGGKDRTGLLTAFLLHVSGVEVEDIAADYALSEERLRPRTQAWLEAAETDAEREEIVRISRTPADVIVRVFDELERRYGSVEAYLRAAGVEEEDLERVRVRLRG